LDIHIDVPPVPVRELGGEGLQEGSNAIRARVTTARARQAARYRQDGMFSNAQLKPRHVKKYCVLDQESQQLIERAMSKLGLSARAYGRILRVARTIADLADCEQIQTPHVAEAIQYRSLDRQNDL
jgi:magnesium chelatase family protein